jgi:hypothetical protein
MTARHYPENEMMFAPDYPADFVQSWQRFFDLREDLLLKFGYNTARAYWGDLQDWFEWAVERDKDVLALTERDVKQYCALMRRRKYSESTIRRRRMSLRALYRHDGSQTSDQETAKDRTVGHGSPCNVELGRPQNMPQASAENPYVRPQVNQ